MPRGAKQQKDHEYTLTVKEICAIMRVNRRAGYVLVQEGRFPVLRLGRIIRIPKEPFLQWWKSVAQKKT